MPLRGCLVVLVLCATLAEDSAAADHARHLSFSWPAPTQASACGLEDSGVAANRPSLRFAGTVERSEFGIACTVQIARRRFDSMYRFCSVENVDAVPRERYACLVVYSPSHVTFVYSYTDDFYGAPACEFTCSPK